MLSWRVMTVLVTVLAVRSMNMLTSEKNNCSNCTALTKQIAHVSWHIESYDSILEDCEFDGIPGRIEGKTNFGEYDDFTMNPNHRCTSSNTSTTQHCSRAPANPYKKPLQQDYEPTVTPQNFMSVTPPNFNSSPP